jgi:hypothetical protein
MHGLGIKRAGCDALIDAVAHLTEVRRCVLGGVTPDEAQRVALVQQRLRMRTGRHDIVVCSWPLKSSLTPRRRPRKAASYSYLHLQQLLQHQEQLDES